MYSPRIAIATFLLTAVSPLVGPARADDKKKDDPKAAEVEKLMFDVPNDVTQGEWIKTWREKLIISFSQEMVIDPRGQLTSGEIVRFTLENKTPCTIKVLGDLSKIKWQNRLAGLTTDGKAPKKPVAKEKPEEPVSETWTVEPGKKLVVFKKPVMASRVMEVPLRNDFDKKALISVLYTGPICSIEIVPTDKEAKPLELLLLSRVGANGIKVAKSGFYLCRSADVKNIMDIISRSK